MTLEVGYSPKCMKLFEENQKLAIKCNLHYNCDEGYEIDEGRDRHCVQLREKSAPAEVVI